MQHYIIVAVGGCQRLSGFKVITNITGYTQFIMTKVTANILTILFITETEL